MNKKLLPTAPLLLLLLLTACASAPPAAPVIQTSAASVDAARSAGATDMAAVDLNNARAKLDRARALSQAGNQREATRLAHEADVDAQLARAKAGAERSKRAVAELDASLQSLRDEINRGTPSSRAP